MKKTFALFLFSIIVLTSCSSEKSGIVNYRKALNYSGEKNPLGFLSQTDTLTLSAKYAECGEFGGHNEVMKIYRNYTREYFLHFKQDSIDLDCPIDFEEKAVLIKDTTIRINLKHEKLIVKYLDKLYKRAIEPKSISHSNEFFRATTNHSAFSLSTAEPEKEWHEFRKLKQALIK